MQLLTNAGVGETGDTVEIHMPGRGEISRLLTLFVWGTFDGTTVTLQISPDGSEWFDVTDASSITSKIALNVQFRCKYVRAITTGGTAPAVNAALR